MRSVTGRPRGWSLEHVTADAFVPLGPSRRKCAVLLWFLRGKTNPEVAVILGRGVETVTTRLKRLFLRHVVTTRAGAITRHRVCRQGGAGGPHWRCGMTLQLAEVELTQNRLRCVDRLQLRPHDRQAQPRTRRAEEQPALCWRKTRLERREVEFMSRGGVLSPLQ